MLWYFLIWGLSQILCIIFFMDYRGKRSFLAFAPMYVALYFVAAMPTKSCEDNHQSTMSECCKVNDRATGHDAQ